MLSLLKFVPKILLKLSLIISLGEDFYNSVPVRKHKITIEERLFFDRFIHTGVNLLDDFCV